MKLVCIFNVIFAWVYLFTNNICITINYNGKMNNEDDYVDNVIESNNIENALIPAIVKTYNISFYNSFHTAKNIRNNYGVTSNVRQYSTVYLNNYSSLKDVGADHKVNNIPNYIINKFIEIHSRGLRNVTDNEYGNFPSNGRFIETVDNSNKLRMYKRQYLTARTIMTRPERTTRSNIVMYPNNNKPSIYFNEKFLCYINNEHNIDPTVIDKVCEIMKTISNGRYIEKWSTVVYYLSKGDWFDTNNVVEFYNALDSVNYISLKYSINFRIPPLVYESIVPRDPAWIRVLMHNIKEAGKWSTIETGFIDGGHITTAHGYTGTTQIILQFLPLGSKILAFQQIHTETDFYYINTREYNDYWIRSLKMYLKKFKYFKTQLDEGGLLVTVYFKPRWGDYRDGKVIIEREVDQTVAAGNTEINQIQQTWHIVVKDFVRLNTRMSMFYYIYYNEYNYDLNRMDELFRKIRYYGTWSTIGLITVGMYNESYNVLTKAVIYFNQTGIQSHAHIIKKFVQSVITEPTLVYLYTNDNNYKEEWLKLLLDNIEKYSTWSTIKYNEDNYDRQETTRVIVYFILEPIKNLNDKIINIHRAFTEIITPPMTPYRNYTYYYENVNGYNENWLKELNQNIKMYGTWSTIHVVQQNDKVTSEIANFYFTFDIAAFKDGKFRESSKYALIKRRSVITTKITYITTKYVETSEYDKTFQITDETDTSDTSVSTIIFNFNSKTTRFIINFTTALDEHNSLVIKPVYRKENNSRFTQKLKTILTTEKEVEQQAEESEVKYKPNQDDNPPIVDIYPLFGLDDVLTVIGVVAAVVAVFFLLWLLFYCIKRCRRKMGGNDQHWLLVGKLMQIYIYPVRSLAPVFLNKATCSPKGVKYEWVEDKSFLIVNKNNVVVSASDYPELQQVRICLWNHAVMLQHTGVASLYVDMRQITATKPYHSVQLQDVNVMTVDCGDVAAGWLTGLLCCYNDRFRLVHFPSQFCTKNKAIQKKLMKSLYLNWDSPFKFVAWPCCPEQRFFDILEDFKPNFVVDNTTACSGCYSFVKIRTQIFKVTSSERCIAECGKPYMKYVMTLARYNCPDSEMAVGDMVYVNFSQYV